MSWKNKIIFIFLCIITFGIFYFIVKKNTNKNNNKKKEKLKINVESLISDLEGWSNIIKAENIKNKVKIFLLNTQNIKLEKINKNKYISGVFLSSNYIVLIVGNQSALLAKEINIQK